MNRCIVVPSVTYAQKAMSVLRKNGIFAYTRKIPDASVRGCAWCIALRPSDVPTAFRLFAQNGVATTGETYDV